MGVAEIWHTLTSDEAIIQLRSDSHRGLSTSEAESRLQEIGLNAIQEADKTPWWSIFLVNFKTSWYSC